MPKNEQKDLPVGHQSQVPGEKERSMSSAMDSWEAVVYKEHTLGLRAPGERMIGVLRSSVLRGAIFSVHDDPFIADEKDLRPATKQDFIDFRVRWHPAYLVADDKSPAPGAG